jgi:hypothetical protein
MSKATKSRSHDSSESLYKEQMEDMQAQLCNLADLVTNLSNQIVERRIPSSAVSSSSAISSNTAENDLKISCRQLMPILLRDMLTKKNGYRADAWTIVGSPERKLIMKWTQLMLVTWVYNSHDLDAIQEDVKEKRKVLNSLAGAAVSILSTEFNVDSIDHPMVYSWLSQQTSQHFRSKEALENAIKKKKGIIQSLNFYYYL